MVMINDKVGNPTGIGLDGHYEGHFPINRWADSVVIGERPSGNAGTDATNIATAIANAKARAYGSGRMVPLHFIPGHYFVDEPVDLSNVIPDLDFHGSTVEWRGDPGLDVFNLEHAREGHIRNLTVVATSSYPARSGFRWWRSDAPGMTLSPSKMTWENVNVYGYPNAFDFGWKAGDWDGVDANVDFGKWINCTALYYNNAGWKLEGTQGYGHTFHECYAESYGAGDYGVDCSLAYFKWFNGAMVGNKVADFAISSWGYDNYEIYHYLSENSNMAVLVRDSVIVGLRVIGGRFAGNNMRADGKVIVVDPTTYLNLYMSQFHAGDGHDGSIPVQFDFEGAHADGRIELHGVKVVSASAPNPPWGSRAPDKAIGVLLNNESGGTFTAVTDID